MGPSPVESCCLSACHSLGLPQCVHITKPELEHNIGTCVLWWMIPANRLSFWIAKSIGRSIRCPLCGWSPREDDRWSCTCGNAFDTGGVCPACLYVPVDFYAVPFMRPLVGALRLVWATMKTFEGKYEGRHRYA